MPLTDQQLRQELLGYGDTVPPITQRNREQLRTRLEFLRSRKTSPTRTRSNGATSSTTTRSRSGRALIELSDSETDISTNEYLAARSRGKTSTTSARPLAVDKDTNRTSSHTSSNVTADVEESIARHRREIQQLIDSARERSRAANANISLATPVRSTPLPRGQPPSTANVVQKPKQPSWFCRSQKSIQTFWRTNRSSILNIFKALLIGCIFGAALIFLKTKGGDLFPRRRGILCSPNNATECDEMIPMVDAVRRFLQTRTGEIDCGFRPKSSNLVTKNEINKYLDGKNYKFEMGFDERWNTLITYIVKKPVDDIIVWDNNNQQVTSGQSAFKLSAPEGIHPFSCRARKSFNSVVQNLVWLFFGTSAILLFVFFIKRRSKQRELREKTYKEFVDKILDLLENQYEEHLANSETKPWLAISHIRDTLIPAQDRGRLKPLWDRAQKQISENESRVRAESQLIHGEEFDVWRWIQPRSPTSPSPQRKKRTESPKNSNEESYVYMPVDVGLTECLKLRNFFDSNSAADDDEIDLVVDSIQNRCATVQRIEHIGIHSVYVYLKFSSKEAAAQGFHFLNDWKYHGRQIIAKYLRLERYHEHFPEARESGSFNN